MLPAVWITEKSAGGGGGDRGRVEHQRGGVVEEGLAFQDGEQPPGQADPPGHAGRRGRVGGADRRTQHKRDGPGQMADPVGDGGHAKRGRHHQQDGQCPDGAGVAEEPGRR